MIKVHLEMKHYWQFKNQNILIQHATMKCLDFFAIVILGFGFYLNHFVKWSSDQTKSSFINEKLKKNPQIYSALIWSWQIK